MVGILLIAHTPLASAFLAAATHVYRSEPAQLMVIDVQPDQDVAQVFAQCAQAVELLNTGSGVLILADVCGATPANCAQRLVNERDDCALVYGLNLPMLLRAMNYRALDLADVAQKAFDGAVCGSAPYERQGMPPCALT